MALFSIKFTNAPEAVLFGKSKKSIRTKVKNLKFAMGFKPKIKSITKVK